MTTRPPQPARESITLSRTKHLCHLIEVRTVDGREPIRSTDHDRILTDAEGHQYRPIIMGAMSADRREAALRSGNQEATGIIDGTLVTTESMESNRFLGAEVRMVVTDWRTMEELARHRKWIRSVRRTGSTWTATLEGRTQMLQRPNAGRFGGAFNVKCPYKLGGVFCKKDIGEWTQLAPPVSGTSTSATSLSLTDNTETWVADDYIGFRVVTFGGGIGSGQERLILSNTTDTIEIDEPWDVIPSSCSYRIGLGPEVTTVVRDTYEFEFDAGAWTGTQSDDWYRDGAVEFTSGANAGSSHSIAQYVEATKRIVLLVPTLLPVEVGDTAIIRVGCDGLFSTCKTKFANQINFGGDPFQPSAQQLIKPPEDA